MTLDPFFRRMSMMAGVFAFLGVILGVVALATNYWTMENMPPPGMPMPMVNGTMPMNDNFEWTWNVSVSRLLVDYDSSLRPIGTVLQVHDS